VHELEQTANSHITLFRIPFT